MISGSDSRMASRRGASPPLRAHTAGELTNIFALDLRLRGAGRMSRLVENKSERRLLPDNTVAMCASRLSLHTHLFLLNAPPNTRMSRHGSCRTPAAHAAPRSILSAKRFVECV